MEKIKSTLAGLSIGALLTVALSLGTPEMALPQQGSSG